MTYRDLAYVNLVRHILVDSSIISILALCFTIYFQHLKQENWLYRSIDRHSPDPGSQAAFYGGHKITVLI